MKTTIRDLAYTIINAINWIAVFVTGLVGVTNCFRPGDWKVEAKGWGNAAKASIEFIQDQQGLVLPISGAIVIITKLMADKLGPAWMWHGIERLLTEYRVHCFTGDALNEPEFHHRVTLFQHVNLGAWWFWFTPQFWGSCWRVKKPAGIRTQASGWLIVVRRSGHTTKRTNVAFLAPDDADFAEGVAGRAWAENNRVLIQNLPEISPQCSPEDVATYATMTKMPVKWVENRKRQNKPLARSLYAIPIETRVKIWGVLVVDSRHPDGIKTKSDHSIIVAALGKFLEKV